MRTMIASLALLSALGIVACDRDITINVPTTPTTPVVKTTIEFRVTGNAQSVRVRYSNPLDGLVQVVTTLPYFNSFSTTQDTIFLSLDATPITWGFVTNPFMSAQILVNGNLFREATSNDFLSTTLSVSGTYRR